MKKVWTLLLMDLLLSADKNASTQYVLGAMNHETPESMRAIIRGYTFYTEQQVDRLLKYEARGYAGFAYTGKKSASLHMHTKALSGRNTRRWAKRTLAKIDAKEANASSSSSSSSSTYGGIGRSAR